MTHTHDTTHAYARHDTHHGIYFFQAIKEAEKHLEIVKSERSLYKSLCKTSTSTLKTHFGEDLQQLPPPGSMVPVNTHNITLHYSFDMAQQVKIYTAYPVKFILILNRCTIHLIHSSLGPSTFLHHASAPFLECVVKLSLDKSIMKLFEILLYCTCR